MNLKKKNEIEFNDDFARAVEFFEKGDKNVFVTGKAGTGKSTLLECFRDKTTKNIVVLAPTGVAALNVFGQTIHSFFRFSIAVTPETVCKKNPSKDFLQMLKKVDILVIDEVSMVRADLMDCVDKFLQFCLENKKSFGGLQMIFIGDLYQLPPVVVGKGEREMFKTVYSSPYFFDAKVFDEFDVEIIELKKVYRQKDDNFIKLLNKIRNNSVDNSDIKLLNTRYKPDFDYGDDEFYITLTTTNKIAGLINKEKLAELDVKSRFYSANVIGDFDYKHYPTLDELEIKIGSQVMMLNNNFEGGWVNGSMGKIVDIEADEKTGIDILVVYLNNGDVIGVYPYTWKVFRYFYNKEKKILDSEAVGSFTQYPISLAWAITIHKSQGKTFDKVVFDIGNGSFAHGQVYVGISRCTSLSGLVLKKPVLKKHIWMDFRIANFLTKYQYQKSEKKMSLDDKIDFINNAIDDDNTVNIVYLKANDVKSKRTIKPKNVGEMGYRGKSFIGVEGYCLKRGEDRVFRVDRILEFY